MLVTLPDICGSCKVSIFGSLHYTLTGTTIAKCDFPEPSVNFYKDANGLKTSISGLSVALAGRWKTRYGIIHDSGPFNMALFNVDVTTVVKLGKDAEGRLSVTAVGCDAKLEDFDLQLHGAARWIYQPIVNHHHGEIKAKIQEKICPVVNKSIANIERHLQSMNVSYDDGKLTLEMPLTSSPVVDASSLSLGFKGEFYSKQNRSEPPFKPQPFTLPVQPGYMLSLGVSEFTLNSASYGYYSAGLLKVLITNSMIPPYVPVHLNTSAMGPYIPQLPEMFPGLPMIVQVYASQVPLFSFKPDSVLLDLQNSVKAFAIQPNGTWTPLFKLNMDFHFSGKAWTSSGKLMGSVDLNNFTLTLAETEVGPFKTEAIEGLVGTGVKCVLKMVNDELKKGIDLPRMKQAVLVNTVLKVNQGFIAVSSDAKVFLPEILTDKEFNLL